MAKVKIIQREPIKLGQAEGKSVQNGVRLKTTREKGLVPARVSDSSGVIRLRRRQGTLYY